MNHWPNISWSDISPYLGIGTIIAGLAAILTFFATRRHHRLAEVSARGDVFREIAADWSRIYDARNVLLNSPVWTAEQLKETYGDNFKAFLNSPSLTPEERKQNPDARPAWREIRPVCNFFEVLGVYLRQNLINAEALFVLVTVDVFRELQDGQTIEVEEGVMYKRLKGPIEYLRSAYRPDIYEYYDKFLLQVFKEHVKSPPKDWTAEIDSWKALAGK
jgi:hypothetical protein